MAYVKAKIDENQIVKYNKFDKLDKLVWQLNKMLHKHHFHQNVLMVILVEDAQQSNIRNKVMKTAGKGEIKKITDNK